MISVNTIVCNKNPMVVGQPVVSDAILPKIGLNSFCVSW